MPFIITIMLKNGMMRGSVLLTLRSQRAGACAGAGVSGPSPGCRQNAMKGETGEQHPHSGAPFTARHRESRAFKHPPIQETLQKQSRRPPPPAAPCAGRATAPSPRHGWAPAAVPAQAGAARAHEGPQADGADPLRRAGSGCSSSASASRLSDGPGQSKRSGGRTPPCAHLALGGAATGRERFQTTAA